MRKVALVVFLFIVVTAVLFGWRMFRGEQEVPPAPVVKQKAFVSDIPPDDFWPDSSLPEVGGTVNLSFKPFDYDLSPRYFTDEDLEKMAKEDERVLEFLVRDGKGFNSKAYEHGFGDQSFLVVGCSGRYSIDPKGAGIQGWTREAMRLPSGQWMKGLPGFRTVFREGGKTHLLTHRRICQFVDEKTLRVVVSADDGSAEFGTIYWDGAYLGHKYISVDRSGYRKSSFGGLLEHRDEGWVFHSYSGSAPGYNLRAKLKGEKIMLEFDTFSNPAKGHIEFNREAGTFRDLD